MYIPIKHAISDDKTHSYILDIHDSINKAYKLPFIKYDGTLNNKNVVTDNNNYYHPLKNELEKLYDIWYKVFSILLKNDNIDEKTLSICKHIFAQLYIYLQNHSFIMRKPLNYNFVLMYNRLYDILNTTITPLVIDIYNIVRNDNLTIKQQDKINSILSNIKSYYNNLNKIITHNNA